MKRAALFALLLFFASLAPAMAGQDVACTVRKVAQHRLLVTFSWQVTVTARKPWDACDLRISFRDAEDREIHAVSERLQIPEGNHTFSGSDICDKDLWGRFVKYVATVDCVF